MNGRIYDPLLGRFLSADAYIQFPGNLQSYNRYSYVQNNPLTFKDDTGHFINFVVGFAVGAVVDVGIQMATNYATGKNLTDISVGSALVSGTASAAGVGTLALVKRAKTAVDLAKRAKDVGYVSRVTKSGELVREVVGEAGQQVLQGEAKKRIAEAAVVATMVTVAKKAATAVENEVKEQAAEAPKQETPASTPAATAANTDTAQPVITPAPETQQSEPAQNTLPSEQETTPVPPQPEQEKPKESPPPVEVHFFFRRP